MKTDFTHVQFLEAWNGSFGIRIKQFEGSIPSVSASASVGEEKELLLNLNGSQVRAAYSFESEGSHPMARRVSVVFHIEQGPLPQANLALEWTFQHWLKDNYVFMPAAAYNGNRFQSRKLPYSPKLERPEDIGPDVPTIITDVPRLELSEGPSTIQLLSGDMAVPCAGFFDQSKQRGFLLLTGQGTGVGDYGFCIRENEDRTIATFTLSAPGVRERTQYRIVDNGVPSGDRGNDFQEGDEVKLEALLYVFDCADLPAFFEQFARIRQDASGPVSRKPSLPFSAVWQLLEDKYNRQNWVERQGYYSVGMRENILQNWQLGWTGGMIATFPLLAEGTTLSRERALRNFEFVMQEAGISPSGFFRTCGDGDKWCADGFRKEHTRHWDLIRKIGDGLYYMLKQVMLLQRQDASWTLPGHWERAFRGCADAFVRLWDRRGQFGQFIHSETGDILVGGSTSGGIVPAALVLAWRILGSESYLRVAEESAVDYYERYIRYGITTGGPGDACQCPDSESAFGLLESYTVLFEETGNPRWIPMARHTADLCLSWCMSYDYRFPAHSTFGKLDMRTRGTMFANVQNKHSAPGICTYSGVSLWKLYRATGERRYLSALSDIAHSLPQYISRENRPIGEMEPGWMNERVNTSDWLEPIGEIFNGSCWPEVSAMLTFAEVPGLYVQPDTGLICVIDHIEAELLDHASDQMRLLVSNPTAFHARVKVYAEKAARMSRTLGQNTLLGCRTVELAPGERRIVTIQNTSRTGESII